MKIDIKITEVLSRIVTVNADSVDDAIDKVTQMYVKEEIILDSSDFEGDTEIEEAK